MIDVLLVEDEPPALERLEAGVRAWDPQARVVGRLRSVRETVAWLRSEPRPDLALMDVQLADGLSLEVFGEVEADFPVIFITAHDRYVLEAFAHNGIDYLLKPITQERLARALDKYRRLKAHLSAELAALVAGLRAPRPRHRERLLVQKGLDFVSLPIGEVAYLYTTHEVVFVRDQAGNQYLLDQPLCELEAELDPARFFRLNRQLIAQVGAVERFRRHGKGRLAVTLRPPTREEVVVSQERAAAFRQWLAGRPA